jgi:hypothetical protein
MSKTKDCPVRDLISAMSRSKNWMSGWLLVALLFLAACRVNVEPEAVRTATAVPPTLTSSPTLTATAPPTQIITPTPTTTAVPTATTSPILPAAAATSGHTPLPLATVILPLSAPDQPPDAYRLAPWSNEAALELLAISRGYAQTIYEADFSHYAVHVEQIRYAQEPIDLAARELLLRFPTSAFSEQVEWQLALASAIMSRAEYDPDDRIIRLLTAGLNDSRYTLNTLARTLQRFGFTLHRIDSNGNTPLNTVTNLFGDGEVANLLLVSRSDGSDGLLLAARQDTTGRYELFPVYSYWGYSHISLSPVAARDLTGDGIPEVISNVHWGSGSMNADIAVVVQWQGDRFVSLPVPFILSAPLSTWQLGPPDSDGRTTIKAVEWQFYFDAYITTTYAWDGRAFVAVARDIETPLFSERDAPIHAEALLYAVNQGYDDFVTASVNHTLDNWSSANAERLGPDYPDYLRFQLAMMHAYRSEATAARRLLESIVTTPASPVTPTISLAARQFLAYYQGDLSLYRACTAALTTAAARGINIVESLCDLRLILKKQVSQTGALQPAGLPDFLEEQGVSVLSAQDLDLDGDGREDWLALLATDKASGEPGLELWAFPAVDAGMTAVYITSYQAGTTPNSFSVTSANLPDLATPIHFVQVGQRLAIITFTDSLGEITVRQWSIDSSSWQEIVTFTLQETAGNIQVTIHFDVSRRPPPYEAVTARWNPARQDFDLVARHAANSLGIPLQEAALQAEWLLLGEGDFQAAVDLFSTILTEPQPAHFYGYGIDWPRLHYLLALAYELTGEADKAVAAYWQLWHDYPDSPYSLMAQRKLLHPG